MDVVTYREVHRDQSIVRHTRTSALKHVQDMLCFACLYYIRRTHIYNIHIVLYFALRLLNLWLFLGLRTSLVF